MIQSPQSVLTNLDSQIHALATIRDGLVTEISALETNVERHRAVLSQHAAPVDDCVFAEGDTDANDFDHFFGESDPEIEKIRNDLLKDSPHRRRFGVLPARLSA